MLRTPPIIQHLTAQDDTSFQFRIDGEGNYGYLKGDGTFSPFKKGLQKVKIGEYQRSYNPMASETKQFAIPDELQGKVTIDNALAIIDFTNCTGGYLYATVTVTSVTDTTVSVKASNGHNTGGGGTIKYSVWLYY